MKKLLQLLIFSFVLSLSSCVNDLNMNDINKEVNIGTSLVIPLGHSRASAFDVFSFIDSESWRVDSAAYDGLGMIYLYKEKLLSLPISDRIIEGLSESKANEYSIKEKTNWFTNTASPHTTGGNVEQFTIFEDYDFDFEYNDTVDNEVVQRVDAVNIASATLNVSVDLQNIAMGAGLSAYIDVQFSFPEIPSFSPETIHLTQADGGHKEASFNISNVLVNFPTDNTTTAMRIDVFIYSQTGGSAFVFNASTSDIVINAQMENIYIDKAWGYFNRQGKLTGDSIDQVEIPSDLFGSEDILENNLLFHDPRVYFDIVSNLGVPLDFIVDSIKAVDGHGNKRWADFDGQGRMFDTVPLGVPAFIGEEAFTSALYNRAHGATNQLFEIKTEHLQYGFHVEVNHKQARQDLAANRQHFLSRPFKVEMTVRAMLDLWFDPTTKYERLDTITADIKSLLGYDGSGDYKITPEKVSVNIDFKNSLPVKVKADVDFIDENDVVVLTKRDIIIECPNVDNEGKVIAPREFNLKIALVGDETDSVIETKKIIVKTTGTADNNTNSIKICGTDYFDIFVSLFVKGKLSTEL